MSRVIIIDDERDLANTFQEYLEMKGHTVYIAYGGVDGLNLIQEHEVDLVIMDVLMSDLHGHEVIERLGEDVNKAPIYMHTGDCDKTLDEKFRILGARGVLRKPFGLEELDKLIAKHT